MVLDVEPVAHVAAVAVDRQAAALDGVEDHQRDQLLGELVGAVVVRAVRDQHGQPVGLVPGPDQVVGPGLRGGVGRVRGVGRRLGEQAVRPERAVDLVGRDVQEAEARRGRRLVAQVEARRLEQLVGAHEVRAHEAGRVVDRAVDVRLGREVDDRLGPPLADERAHGRAVGDVAVHERVARVLRDVRQALQVAGVGERVQHDHPRLRAGERVAHEVAADEAGAAGDEDRAHATSRPARGSDRARPRSAPRSPAGCAGSPRTPRRARTRAAARRPARSRSAPACR